MNPRHVCLVISSWLALGGCSSSVRPLDPATRLNQREAAKLDLVFEAPCFTTGGGGAPMGRPDGARGHVLPAGRYHAAFEDDRGVYFASPEGVAVTEPAPRGTRTLPGGVQVLHDDGLAYEYLGEQSGVSARERLPEHCKFQLLPAKS